MTQNALLTGRPSQTDGRFRSAFRHRSFMLVGDAGNDTLSATLEGGAGGDWFVFNTTTGLGRWSSDDHRPFNVTTLCNTDVLALPS